MYKEVINQNLLIRPLHQAHFPISYEEEEEEEGYNESGPCNLPRQKLADIDRSVKTSSR